MAKIFAPKFNSGSGIGNEMSDNTKKFAIKRKKNKDTPPIKNNKSFKYIKKQHSLLTAFKCRFCPMNFSKPLQLIVHQRLHEAVKPFKCRFCEEYFSRPERLIEHQRHHLDENPFRCRFCAKDFEHPADFLRHQSAHFSQEQLTCGKCEKCFDDPSVFIQHVSRPCSEYAERPKEGLSDVSETVNEVLPSFDIEQQKVITSTKQEDACNVCGKCCQNLDLHIGMQHLHSPLECVLCKKSFGLLVFLRHIKSHSK